MTAPRKSTVRSIAGRVALGLLVLIGAFLTWGFVEPRMVDVAEYTVTSPDLPPEFSGTKVAYMADIHAGPYFSRDRVAALVDKVNGLGPDLILLGGDYVGGRTGGAEKFYPEAARLRASKGVFAVLGNHDYWEGEAQARAGLAGAGIRVLDNQTSVITSGSASVRLGGLPDMWEGRPDIQATDAGVSSEDFAMLLSHNPDLLATALPESDGVWDLALAGHTHSGQVTLFGRAAPMVPSQYGTRYLNGWLEENKALILVTSGIGAVTVPLRFFARPRIELITLERGSQLAVKGATARRYATGPKATTARHSDRVAATGSSAHTQ